LAKKQLNLDIHLIDGLQEAELIYLGVRKSFSMGIRPHLIMDIGGGSVEFIIANEKEIFWKESFELGISRIKGLFNFDDPMTDEQSLELNEYLEKKLTALVQQIKKHNPSTLIGSSGSFDSFALVNSFKEGNPAGYITHPCSILKYDELLSLLNELITKSLAERIVMKGMRPMRAEMIAISSIMVKYVLNHSTIKNVFQSSYALKEGVIEKIIAEPSWME